jgi:ABC-2 type transport system ATP-binding protein
LDEPVLGLDANHRDVFYKLLIEKYSNYPATYVISTHLIEEVSNVIEDVIIIKKGKIIRNESREELMSVGYTVSGMASLVDDYIKGKELIGTDSIGGLKSAYVMGKVIKNEIPEGLEITKMDLQKLFVQITNI